MADPRDTPAMRQYYRFKKQHPDCLLLFRIGDFYETFDDDAVTISRAAGLTLTQRTEGVPMAGMPHHQLDTYLRRLIDRGYRVAVCDQVEDPAAAKARGGASAIIERAVTRVLTPGTLVDESLLQPEAQATLAAVCYPDGGDRPDSPVHAAIIDLSTGRFTLADSTVASVADELVRRHVSELLFSAPADNQPPPRVRNVLAALRISGTPCPAWHFRYEESLEMLKSVFGVASLAGFGLRDDDPALPAAGAILRYLRLTQPGSDPASLEAARAAPAGSAPDVLAKLPRASLAHIQPPHREDPAGVCVVDAVSLRSLEVLGTIRASAGVTVSLADAPAATIGPHTAPVLADASLAGIFATTRHFPGCRTAMGKRLLRDWLCRPLCDLRAIESRQDCVATFVEDRRLADDLAALLAKVQDVARIGGRVALARATPRDLVALGRSLATIRELESLLGNSKALRALRETIAGVAGALAPLAEEIARCCVDAPPAHMREGGLVREGVDAELDEARVLRADASTWMAEYQARLIAEHDLPSLKVGYNKIFGYYIELPSAQSRRAPDVFSRKQTLKSAERYITPELREFEIKVSTAESRALAREVLIFERLCAAASSALAPINTFADAVAELDVLACFAEKAVRRSWTRPRLVEEPVLAITQGRHPVLDELLENRFVPNDVRLGVSEPATESPDTPTNAHSPSTHPRADGLRPGPALALITGPNMAGKSTFIRQTALLVLLAHAGSFIPAKAGEATIGLVDRIFTRVGADDALHAGQSTFMVEMTETARILNHVTPRSLVILDEIGRGTSTLDGLSLAWAIAETLSGRLEDPATPATASPAPATTPTRKPRRRAPDPSTPRTLFATHYHELTDLEDLLPTRVKNLHVAVREWGDDVVFLHRILPGRADQSYGVHVAKLAGMPERTVNRAREVLQSLAVQHGLLDPTQGAHAPASAVHDGAGSSSSNGTSNGKSTRARSASLGTPAHGSAHAAISREGRSREGHTGQLGLFTEYLAHPAVDALRELKLDALSPLQAFDELRKLKAAADGSPTPQDPAAPASGS